MTRTRWRSCLHKTPMTEEVAREHAKQEDTLMAYRCKYDDTHWHVGHRRKTKTNASRGISK